MIQVKFTGPTSGIHFREAHAMAATKRKDAPAEPATAVKKLKIAKSYPAQNKTEDRRQAVKHEEQSFPSKTTTELKPTTDGAPKGFKLETTSAEAHAKQRAQAKERKASKPNADVIQRSKKIWERLRRKSHVPPEERRELVTELFSIITGRVRDFVFKHDSVRVIQCALKYANQEQRRLIARELKGDMRTLAESRYGKYLVAKMVEERDDEVRDAVIPEFYGHIRRLINHPEASWIVDDIYRQAATRQQKANMLREWYGAEFALFRRKSEAKVSATVSEDETADLEKILEKSPEKRKPILQYLLQMINSLIQKKLTGFTMLHDAMLQYCMALTPGSEEHAELLAILNGDIDAETEGGGGDLFRNLAFTKSGCRLVCLALAYGSAKDRKLILRVFKDTVDMMAHDQYAKVVLIAGMEVPDDTKMTAKSILSELVGQNIEDETQRLDRLEGLASNLNARLPLLYPMAGMAKWLISDADKEIMQEVHKIRKTTSKKAPEVRRMELLEYVSNPLLELVLKRAETLLKSSFGCQFVAETLLEANGEHKPEAVNAIAQLAAGDPASDGHLAKGAAAGRMLKTLVLGGNFDAETRQIKLADPPLNFGEKLYPVIKDRIVDWACSDSSFVVVALLESTEVSQDVKKEMTARLVKNRKRIERIAKDDGRAEKTASGKEKSKPQRGSGNAGARIVLQKLA